MTPPPQRIFVTGLGAVTPLGFSVPDLWRNLLAGTDGISTVDLFDLGGIACTRGGVVRGYALPANLAAHAPPDRATTFALGACAEALGAPGRHKGPLPPAPACARPPPFADIGLVTATNFGAIDVGEQALTGTLTTPAAWACCAQDTAAERLASAFGLGGPRVALSLSCATGAAALAQAAAMIRRGQARRMLVVGFDALSRFAWSGLCSLRTMTKEHVRPFDLNRAGTLFTEGAAALLLEAADSVGACQSPPLAELRGWATNNNGFHLTAPAPRGAGSCLVMQAALASGGIALGAVDHINAHGTGTKPNDSTESQALLDLFGARGGRIPVTSIKAALGHMMGAAGTVEAIASVLTLRDGVIPPTTHYDTPDPECPVDVVANRSRVAPVSCVLSNSAGIGGCNAAVVFTQP
jgi:3-oxoacyl-(acyl-carrier-protein) synthase